MAKASKATAPQVEEVPGFEGRYAHLDEFTVGFETYTEDQDPAPLFVGLPDDACQCPHWGYVLRGSVSFRYSDGITEEYRAGDAYVARPGHTPLLTAGTEVVEFSPTVELDATMEVVFGNIAKSEA